MVLIFVVLSDLQNQWHSFIFLPLFASLITLPIWALENFVATERWHALIKKKRPNEMDQFPCEQGCSLSLFLFRYQIESSLLWVLLFLFELLISEVQLPAEKPLSLLPNCCVIFYISSGCSCSLAFAPQIFVLWSELMILTHTRFYYFIRILVIMVWRLLSLTAPQLWTCWLYCIHELILMVCFVLYFHCCLLYSWFG